MLFEFSAYMDKMTLNCFPRPKIAFSSLSKKERDQFLITNDLAIKKMTDQGVLTASELNLVMIINEQRTYFVQACNNVSTYMLCGNHTN